MASAEAGCLPEVAQPPGTPGTPVLASQPLSTPQPPSPIAHASAAPRRQPLAFVAVATERGRRPHQEDVAVAVSGWPNALDSTPSAAPRLKGTLFQLFDGHGGDRAAQFAATHLPALLANAVRRRHELETAREQKPACAAAVDGTSSALPLGVVPSDGLGVAAEGPCARADVPSACVAEAPRVRGHGPSLAWLHTGLGAGLTAGLGAGPTAAPVNEPIALLPAPQPAQPERCAACAAGGACAFGGGVSDALCELDVAFCEWARQEELNDGSTVLLALLGGCDVHLDGTTSSAELPRAPTTAAEVAAVASLRAASSGAAATVGGAAEGTGASALRQGEDETAEPSLHVANIGDSRCVLGRAPSGPGGNGRRASRSPMRSASLPLIEAVRLSHDHRPGDLVERARILRAGGRVAAGRVGIDGSRMSLSVSRCLGDVALKDAGTQLAAAAVARLALKEAATQPPQGTGAQGHATELPQALPTQPAATAAPPQPAPAALAAGARALVAQGGDERCAQPHEPAGASSPPALDGTPAAAVAPPPRAAARAPKRARATSASSCAKSGGGARREAVISVEPHVCARKLCEADRFLILGSDGLYDGLTDAAAVACVAQRLRNASARSPARKLDGCALARECAQALCTGAIGAGSCDNVTALVVLFDWG
jgi:serine/threonine protein phosphatase PrpC